MTDEKVHHPAHYNTGKIEVIDAIEDWKLGFHEGNVVKYVARARHKGTELLDLQKAAWYLNRAIERLEDPVSFIASVLVHAYFSQNYAGTACGAEGTSSEIPETVSCPECKRWLGRSVKTVHIAEQANKPALCGSFGCDSVTSDPMAATCVECKKIYDIEAEAKKAFKSISSEISVDALVAEAEEHLREVDDYHGARKDKCSYELMEKLVAALKGIP